MKILIITFLIVSNAFGSDSNKSQTNYKYKDYDVIDLGAIEIKGQIIAPGDLTVKEKERKTFKRELLEKDNFDFENKRDIENLR